MKNPVCLLVLLCLISAESHAQKDIAQWRGPERNGVYPEKNLLTGWPAGGPQLVWKYDSLGAGFSSAAVTSQRIYTVGTIDSVSYIFIFDHSGNLLSRKPLGREWMANWPGIRATPAIYGGLGYVVNGFGVLYCFSPENGDIIWSRDIMRDFNGRNQLYGFCENLVIDGNKLFCTPGGIEANVVALNRKTGDLIWTSRVNSDSCTYANPILIETNGKKFLIDQTQKTLFALDAENGNLAWKYELKSGLHPNTPIYRDGYLFVYDGSDEGSIMLKIDEDGTGAGKVWNNPEFMPIQGDAVALGDRLYGLGGGDKKFMCSDWKTGKEIYADSVNAVVITVISAENLIYSYDIRGNFRLLKPVENGFEKLGSFRVKGGSGLHCSHPVIQDGRLYVRHDNSLFVYNIAK